MTSLPSFKRPPVKEVALALQFEPLAGLSGPVIGVLGGLFRDRFPSLQVHPPRGSTFETFDLPDAPQPRIVQLDLGTPPAPRVWFVGSDESELIQVQQDRFVFNWRHRGNEYPRYEQVKKSFAEHLETFRGFLSAEALGDLKPNQWEVSYVNHIVAGDVWQSHSELGKVLPSWSHSTSDGFLATPEDINLKLRYPIEDGDRPVGRLHIVLESAFTLPEKKPMFVLRLTARGGLVDTEELTDVFRYLDLGHEWIVRGFASITSPDMHERWERED